MKPKFKIGQWVEVSQSLYFSNRYDKYKGWMKEFKKMPLTEPKRGVIVGATYKHTGILHEGGYDSSAYLEVDKATLVWKVRTGYLNKPILAQEEDIKEIEAPGKNIPWKLTDPRASAEMKKMYAQHPEWFPRDKKGRFVSC